MYPRVGGLSTYYLSWIAAAVAAFIARRYVNRRQSADLPASDRIPFRPWAFVAVALLLPLGAKLLYLVEEQFFRSQPGAFTLITAIGDGFRLPGGILLVGLAAPLVCRAAGLPVLRTVDAALPTMGLAIFFIRVGCFLNGCCFGRLSDLPWSVSFPRGTLAHLWHASLGLVPLSASHSLPVHPLQLYAAAVGLWLFIAGNRWYRRRRFDGEVWLKFFLFYFGSNFVLELLRGYELTLNIYLSGAVFVVTALIAIYVWPPRPSATFAGADR